MKVFRVCVVLVMSLISIMGATPEIQLVDGVSYKIIKTTPESVRVLWKNDEGGQLRKFSSAATYLEQKGEKVLALMNGGIFEPRSIPSGLLIQNKKTLVPINKKKGKGNFYLKPNGVFLVGSAGAMVIDSESYPLKNVEVYEAVQSGPLLLQAGKPHPKFNKGSKSRLHRNGVGVTKDGKVVFVMTDFESKKFPNLYEFAEIFRDLGCDDALFLDGDLCLMRCQEEVHKETRDFSSMIAIVESSKDKE